MAVRKLVIAVAGFGTRLLPATKCVAKELLPVVDKPGIQLLVEEAVASGIQDIIIVTRSGSQAVEDHFDSSLALEHHLAEQGKHDYLEAVRSLATMANFAFVRQGANLPYGNGSPLVAAREFIGRDEPFAYMYGDDLVLSERPCLGDLIALFEAHTPGAVIGAQNVPKQETKKYGIAELEPGSDPLELKSVVEKPAVEEAPSTLALLGRFVFDPRILEILQQQKTGKGGELWLTDAIATLNRDSRVLVHEIAGTWYTTGDPLALMIANLRFGLRDPRIGADLRAYLKELAAEL